MEDGEEKELLLNFDMKFFAGSSRKRLFFFFLSFFLSFFIESLHAKLDSVFYSHKKTNFMALRSRTTKAGLHSARLGVQILLRLQAI